ncbi:MAG: hypothetical protein RL033_2605 [Pseudomonadota bacterium]
MASDAACYSLPEFLRRVACGVDHAIESAGLDAPHRALLGATVRRFRAQSARDPLSDPLCLFYLIARAESGAPDAAGLELAVFCQLYLSALDLLDDVQDQDLAGKPHAEAGPAVALNSGLFLLFLGLAALERGMRAAGHVEALELVARVGLLTGRGQYRDLQPEADASPERVLEIAREKTASLSLICELAALHATPEPTRRARYRAIGESFSLFVQVLDDLRDLFGKRQSPDLEQGRPNYAIACFLRHASPAEKARFTLLQAQRPLPLRELRSLLYESGSVQRAAAALDGFRRAIHRESAGLESSSPWLRLLLFTLDGLASTVYTPKPVSEGQSLALPASEWHVAVRRQVRQLAERLRTFGLPDPPPLVPWHLSQWLYEPTRQLIYYADLEGMAEETLPFQAALLGEQDLQAVSALVTAQLPAVLAHELFHFHRHQCGRMGTDVWLEELAANSLSIAYCRRFEPRVLEQSLELAERVLAQVHNTFTPEAAEVLKGLLEEPPRTPGGGYEMSMQQMALVQMGMVRHLAQQSTPLEQALQHWLGVRV